MNGGGRDSSGRGYVPVVKFIGDYVHVVKSNWGIMSTLQKHGGLCPPLRK